MYVSTQLKPYGKRSRLSYKGVKCANEALGDPVNFGIKNTRKLDHAVAVNFQKEENKLHSWPLIYIPYDADEKNLIRRPVNTIHIRGVKLHAVINVSKDLLNADPPSFHYQLRWALISSKDTKKATGSFTDISDVGFFHEPTPMNMNDFQRDFSQSLTEMDHMRLKINEKEYCILKEGRKYLHFGNTCYPNSDRIVIDEYIKLNRQMSFGDVTDNYPEENNIWFVWWAIPRNKTDTLTRQSDVFQWNSLARIYFRVPKGIY